MYYCLRHGLYSEACKEIAAVAKKSGADLLGSGGKSRSSSSQTRAGRKGERMKDAARREAHFISHACLIIEGLASNHSTASLRQPHISRRSRGSNVTTPGSSSSYEEQNTESDLTSEAIMAAVSDVKEYYHSYLYSLSVQRAEQRYNATHDTHHHHHSHYGQSTRRTGGAMDAYKELVIYAYRFRRSHLRFITAALNRRPQTYGRGCFVGFNVPAALLQTLAGALSSRVRGDQSVRRRSAMLHRLGIFV